MSVTEYIIRVGRLTVQNIRKNWGECKTPDLGSVIRYLCVPLRYLCFSSKPQFYEGEAERVGEISLLHKHYFIGIIS